MHTAFRAPRKQDQSWQIVEAESIAGGSGWMDMPESQPPAEIPVEVFPRLKERDNYKCVPTPYHQT